MTSVTLTVTAEPSADDLTIVGQGLTDFNTQDVGPAERVPLTVLVRDETGAVRGGISGYTAWGWLYVKWLWLDAGLRGQGLAAQMLDAAEAEALRRG